MPSFVHPLLLWGLPVMAAPVVIHLINMLRHRRVEWAAMEFLLVSQRKHRTWIILKQLLLLLLRIVAVAVVVLMVAQPLLRNQWGNLLGSGKTHHVVLLDDSFSMSDRWADSSAFAEAKGVVGRIAAAAARETQPQTFTLLRFSRVGRASNSGPQTQPDLVKERVDAEFPAKLTKKLEEIKVSQTAAEPAPALEALEQLLHGAEAERRIVYLISDFRTRQWEEPTELKKRLAQLGRQGVELRLVDCVDRARPNLAITALGPAEGIRAAGVQWYMEVTVRNFGPTMVKDVPVLLSEDGHGRSAVTIAEIPPGKEATKPFPVNFTLAGQHLIAARLEDDAVSADDFRYAVVDLPAEVPVLLVDGDPAAGDARYLDVALTPGGEVRTGIRTRIETPRFLSSKPLAEFQAINLANFDRLDQSAIDALERYVRDGGGLAVFLGPQSDSRFINEALYRQGQGLFPLPLVRPADLPPDRLEEAPDLEADTGHFIFQVFAENRNSFLNAVLVERYFAVPAGWKPPPASGTRVLARLRNGAPLVVARSFGRGQVVAFLTTAAPVWNNWARNPSFVVAMLNLQAHLSERPAAGGSRRVAAPLEVKLDPASYQPQVRFNPPARDVSAYSAEDALLPVSVDAVRAGDGQLSATLPGTDRAGFYQASLTRTGGKIELRHYAVNVDAAEGDLRMLAGPDLATRLQPEVKYEFFQAAAFEIAVGEESGHNLQDVLLGLLVLLLIGEQVLAWSASYHPPAGAQAATAGFRGLQRVPGVLP